MGIMLVKDGKILLGRRHSDPDKADSELHGEGTWTMPGGKLEFGEGFVDGISREVMEETGIKVRSASVFCVNNDKAQDAHFVTIGLVSSDFEGEARVMEPDEIVEWRWFEIARPPSPIFPPSRVLLECYLEKRVNKY